MEIIRFMLRVVKTREDKMKRWILIIGIPQGSFKSAQDTGRRS